MVRCSAGGRGFGLYDGARGFVYFSTTLMHKPHFRLCIKIVRRKLCNYATKHVSNTHQNTRFHEIVRIALFYPSYRCTTVSWYRAVRSLSRTICYFRGTVQCEASAVRFAIFVVQCGAEPFLYGLHHWAPCFQSAVQNLDHEQSPSEKLPPIARRDA